MDWALTEGMALPGNIHFQDTVYLADGLQPHLSCLRDVCMMLLDDARSGWGEGEDNA